MIPPAFMDILGVEPVKMMFARLQIQFQGLFLQDHITLAIFYVKLMEEAVKGFSL